MEDEFTTQTEDTLRRSLLARGPARPSPRGHRGNQIRRRVKAKPRPPPQLRRLDWTPHEGGAPVSPRRQPGSQWSLVLPAVKTEEPVSPPRRQLRFYYYLKGTSAPRHPRAKPRRRRRTGSGAMQHAGRRL